MISQSDVTFESARRGKKKKNQLMPLEKIMAENASRHFSWHSRKHCLKNIEYNGI